MTDEHKRQGSGMHVPPLPPALVRLAPDPSASEQLESEWQRLPAESRQSILDGLEARTLEPADAWKMLIEGPQVRAHLDNQTRARMLRRALSGEHAPASFDVVVQARYPDVDTAWLWRAAMEALEGMHASDTAPAQDGPSPVPVIAPQPPITKDESGALFRIVGAITLPDRVAVVGPMEWLRVRVVSEEARAGTVDQPTHPLHRAVIAFTMERDGIGQPAAVAVRVDAPEPTT